MPVSQLCNSLITAAQVIVAMALFEGRLPRRPKFWCRVIACGALVAGAAALFGPAYDSALEDSFVRGMWFQIAGFAVAPLAMTLATMACLRVSLWEALFCCTSAYTMQNLASGASGLMNFTLFQYGLGGSSETLAPVCTVAATAIVYACCYVLLVRRIGAGGLAGIQDRGMLLVMSFVILVTVVFDMVNKTLPIIGVPFPYVATLRVVHGSVCAFILFAEYEMVYNKRLRADAEALERLVEDGKRRYDASRETIEAVNIKCHDLKHQIAALRRKAAGIDGAALDEVERAVQIYDASVHTGSEALDTIITEKSLVCERERISLSCMADGASMTFMAPSDLYSLFGNMLDNAIEAARRIPDRDRRSISLVARKSAGTILIHEENWALGELTFRDGLPMTSKLRADGTPDTLNHGFGMRSMRLVTERYGGTISARQDDGAFKLDALIPLPGQGE